MNRLLGWIAGQFDARDLMLVAGLGLIGYGLWEVYPPASFVVPGAALAGVAIFGVRGG